MTRLDARADVPSDPPAAAARPSPGRLRRLALALALVLVSTACASAPPRIVAFGDVHGDLDATTAALRLAGVIDGEGRWSGGETVVVQTGDQLDRGDDERAILDLFARLSDEAAETGGAFIPLLGNHELMNARGDMRYVTEGGWEDFADVGYVDADPRLAELEPYQRGRVAAFMPGGPYARLLARRDVVRVVEGNVFVHGGVLPAHVAYGIDRLNRETRAWLRGEGDLPEVMRGSDSPQWTRLYSDDPGADACATLGEVLEALDAERMVVGHTVHREGITSACDGRVWMVDTGMAAHYGGPVEVLEIRGDSVRVLREDGSDHGAGGYAPADSAAAGADGEKDGNDGGDGDGGVR